MRSTPAFNRKDPDNSSSYLILCVWGRREQTIIVAFIFVAFVIVIAYQDFGLNFKSWVWVVFHVSLGQWPALSKCYDKCTCTDWLQVQNVFFIHVKYSILNGELFVMSFDTTAYAGIWCVGTGSTRGIHGTFDWMHTTDLPILKSGQDTQPLYTAARFTACCIAYKVRCTLYGLQWSVCYALCHPESYEEWSTTWSVDVCFLFKFAYMNQLHIAVSDIRVCRGL